MGWGLDELRRLETDSVIPCVKHIALAGSCCIGRELSSVLRDDLKGWNGRGGREVQRMEVYIHIELNYFV